MEKTKKFEMSSECKYALLATKSQPRRYAGVTLPGMFESYGELMICLFTIIAFCFEIIPAVFSYNKAEVPIPYLFTPIIGDLACAILAHWNKSKEVLNANRALVEEDDTLKKKFEKHYRKYRNISFIFYGLIVCLAIIKVIFFVQAWGTINDAPPLLITLLYSIAAVVHIFFTGYFVALIKYKLKYRREYNKFIESEGKENNVIDYNPQPIANEGVALLEKEVGDHRLYKAENDIYVLDTYGILTDAELAEFASKQQTPSAKQIVALAGLKQQLDSLNIDNY